MKQKILFGLAAFILPLAAGAATIMVDGTSLGSVQSLNIASDGTIAVTLDGSANPTPTVSPTGSPSPTVTVVPTPSPTASGGCVGAADNGIIHEVIPAAGRSVTQKRAFERYESYAFKVDLSNNSYGRLSLSTNFATYNSDKLIVVSGECGDFSLAGKAPNCSASAQVATLYFGELAGICTPPGDVFYVNVKSATNSNPTGDTCPVGKNCGFYYTMMLR